MQGTPKQSFTKPVSVMPLVIGAMAFGLTGALIGGAIVFSRGRKAAKADVAMAVADGSMPSPVASTPYRGTAFQAPVDDEEAPQEEAPQVADAGAGID